MRSKLVAIELQNIMTIGEARLEFDETGILSLVGYNDSGKSAILFALDTFLYDSHKRDQTDMITDGEESSGIGLEFDDGVEINKYKSRSKPTVWEMIKNGQLVYTNQLPTGVAAIDGVPSVIADYLGVVEDEVTGQRLNVRRNSDKLFLIETTGGENYKMLNTVLQSDVLARASRNVNATHNKMQSAFLAKKAALENLIVEVDAMVVMDEQDVSKLAKSIERMKATRTRYTYILDVANQVEAVNNLQPAPEVPIVDSSRVEALVQMQGFQRVLDAPVYDEIPTVDPSRVLELVEMMRLHALASQVIPPEVPLLDPSRYLDMREYAIGYNDAYHKGEAVKKVTGEYEEITSHLHQLSEVFGFKVCTSCGAVVE